MGNQPSAPAPPSGPPPAPPPPLPPVCDAPCQRQKLLTGLKATLDQKEQTQSQDPEGYEQARIAYYTALNGDGWLAQEKQRIAQDEISPKITGYTNQYNELKNKQSTQQVFVNLMDALEAEQAGDQQDLGYLKKQVQAEKDRADVLNRLAVLGGGSTTTSSYMPIILDVVLAILGLGIVYMLYTKFSIIKGYFGFSQPAMNIGGKRASH
jgi:hypothetical protein